MIKHFLSKNDRYFTLIFWIVLFFIFFLQIAPQSSAIEAILFSSLLILLAYLPTTYLSEVLLTRAIHNKKIKPFICQFLFISFLVGLFFMSLIYLFQHLETIGYFPQSTYFNIKDVPPYVILVFLSAGILINICICGIRFFKENIRLQKALVEYQLQILQKQINPHFMFNVLNHINYYIETNNTLASELLLKYSDILRYQLYGIKKNKVHLNEEIVFLKNFIDVESIRWENNLEVTCMWKIEDPLVEVSPLLFIPLVENAFKHVSRSLSEKGYIDIDFVQNTESIQLTIENSKSTLSPKRDSGASGLGIDNLKKRLDILHFNKYQFVIKETNTVYYSQLTIQLLP